MSKKILALVLCVALLVCTALTATAEFAPVAKEDLKVGFIYVGDVVDKGYTYAHHQGTLAAQAALGLTDDQILVKTNIAEDSACETAINELVEAGCQIIFGNSFGFMSFMAEAAEEYPEVIFCHCSGYMSNDTNFINYFGAIYQARYLSGIAAGLKTQTNKIGYVGSMQTPEVIGGYDAFALGAQSVNPDAVVYVKYTNTWYDATLERQTAEALLDEGCDVIAQHCDTAMPQIAAQERGVWGVGYNADMSEDAPKAHLTAPVWHWEAVVEKEIQAVIDGTWTPENVWMGFADGLVDLSPLTENCAEGTEEAINAAKEKLLSGNWDVFNGPIYDSNDELIIDETNCFAKDVLDPATKEVLAKAGDPVTVGFIASSLQFQVKGVVVE